VMLHRFLVFQLNMANFTNKLMFNFVHVENYRKSEKYEYEMAFLIVLVVQNELKSASVKITEDC